MSVIKYFSAYIFIALGYVSLTHSDWRSYSMLIFSFVLIPLIELLIKENKSANEVKQELAYDLVLYSLVPVYLILLGLFLNTIGGEMSSASRIGKLSAMGLLSGIFGINLAHELGHRQSKFDRFLAQLLLATSQYMHFFIEHNRGHHKRVGTFDDPATARKGEHLYAFWFRTITGSYLSALQLEKQRLKRLEKQEWSLSNDMIIYAIIQLTILVLVGWVFGIPTLLYYLISCLIGILLLETINYIEHYGLTRKKISASAYERVQDVHSWNSDYVLGRVLLFELTRHSHHHANSQVKYARLESRPESSQLPTGYPGMMLLSLVPPLWFRVMNKRL
ncbi:MAG: alkane 1-monooxygenase [Bacteroidia bacterium]|nr:alkane 1-monooxygenase [Bacteroidia bacterium]